MNVHLLYCIIYILILLRRLSYLYYLTQSIFLVYFLHVLIRHQSKVVLFVFSEFWFKICFGLIAVKYIVINYNNCYRFI